MLDRLAKSNHAYKCVIIVMHPVQFHRTSAMDIWIQKIKSSSAPHYGNVITIPFYFVRGLLNMFVLSPSMPGPYGLYYGSPYNLIRSINENKGSAIDPTRIFTSRNPQTLIETPDYGNMRVDLQGVSMTDIYRKALMPLKMSIASLGRDKVYVLLGPIPLGAKPAEVEEILSSFNESARLLGLASDHVIVPKLAFVLDFKYFGTFTHLNGIGKAVYSEALADDLVFLGDK